MRRTPSVVIPFVALAACAPVHERPPSICEQFPEASCGTNSPPGSFGGGGSSTTHDDGGLDAGMSGSVSVFGTLLLARSIPFANVPTGSVPAVNWTVAPVPSVAAGAMTTGTDGTFALGSVPVTGEGVVLEALPPNAGSGLAALLGFVPTGGALTMLTVTQGTLEDTALNAGFVIDARGTASVVIALQGSGAAVAGVSITALGGVSMASVAYDDMSGTLRAGTGTGPYGTIGVFNIPAPVGVTIATATLSRAGRTLGYAVPIAPGHVTWLTAQPP